MNRSWQYLTVPDTNDQVPDWSRPMIDPISSTIKETIKRMMENKLSITESEYDLCILFSSYGKWHKQVNFVALKANMVLRLMKKIFSSWSDEIARIIKI